MESASFDVSLDPEAVVLLPFSFLETQRAVAASLQRRDECRRDVDLAVLDSPRLVELLVDRVDERKTEASPLTRGSDATLRVALKLDASRENGAQHWLI